MARRIDRNPDEPALNHTYDEDAIASLVRIATIFGSARFQRRFDPASLIPDDANAIPAIYAIAMGGPQRPSALAAVLHVSAPTVSRLLERLAAAGLVDRLPDPGDSRATLAGLTSRGHAVADDLFRAGDRLVTDLLADWAPADRDTLERLLHRLADALAATAGEDHPLPTRSEE